MMSSFPTLFDWQVDATEEFGLARRFSSADALLYRESTTTSMVLVL